MKKAISLFLLLALCLSLCACGNSEKEMTAKFEGKKLATSEKKDGVDGRYYNQSFLEFFPGALVEAIQSTAILCKTKVERLICFHSIGELKETICISTMNPILYALLIV